MYAEGVEEVPWKAKAKPKDSTGTQVTAAQEQTFNTRSTEARFNHTRQDHSCRLCKHATEKVQHIVLGCKMQAGTTWHN